MKPGQFALAIGLMSAPAAAEAPVARTPTLENLVASTDACTGKLSSEAKMHAEWTTAGWQAGERIEPIEGMALSAYSRDDVNLHYFISKEMKQCKVWANIPDDYAVDALADAMAIKLNKQPKVEEPGKRYYFRYFSGLKILNLLVKEDKRGRYVELSVVD
jgi:hypothetical protein